MSIKIQPVRFADNGFMTRPFALGISPERSEHCEAMSLEGCEGAEGLDPAVKYRSCLQNWVIDTGSAVILVDTGLPSEYPDMAADPDAQSNDVRIPWPVGRALQSGFQTPRIRGV